MLLAVWAGCLLQSPFWASPALSEPNDSDKELEQVRARLRSVQMSLREIDGEKNSLLGELAEIERQYGALVKALRDLEDDALEEGRRLAAVTKQKQLLRSNVLQQNQALASLSRAAYAAGRRESLKLALNQDDPARFSRVLSYYGYLNRARFAQLQALQQDLAEARRLEDQLGAESGGLELTRVQIRAEQARLAKSSKDRRAVLAKLDVEFRDKSVRLRALQEDEHRLDGLVGALRQAVADVPPAAPVSSPSRGRPGWPIQGPVLAQFGAPRMSGRWDGVLIGAPEGTAVRAVSPGRVAFADWLRGYGLLTIIDHGDGYMSLYAFNQSLYKNVGDWVDAGEIIASVGASGGQREPGLYFGVRENGRPIDPISWGARAN